MEEWYYYLITIGIGLLAGIMNTMAGGGSLLTLPLLIFMGLDPNIANATNRIAIILQNMVGVASFKQQKVLNLRQGMWLAAPAIIGSVIGASLAVELNEKAMKIAIGSLLIVMFFIVLFKPDKWVKAQAGKVEGKPTIIQIVIFFLIGAYGGFIQAGVGFFLLAALVLSVGLDLVKANAIKVLVILFFNIVAISVFIYNDLVDYRIGLVLAIGNMAGAFIGSRIAVSWGPKLIRIILLTTLIVSSLKLFGAIDLIWGLVK